MNTIPTSTLIKVEKAGRLLNIIEDANYAVEEYFKDEPIDAYKYLLEHFTSAKENLDLTIEEFCQMYQISEGCYVICILSNEDDSDYCSISYEDILEINKQ